MRSGKKKLEIFATLQFCIIGSFALINAAHIKIAKSGSVTRTSYNLLERMRERGR